MVIMLPLIVLAQCANLRGQMFDTVALGATLTAPSKPPLILKARWPMYAKLLLLTPKMVFKN